MKVSNLTYDRLKAIAQYIFPASGAAYYTLAQIWNLPYAEQIVGTLAVLNVFLAGFLGVLALQYDRAKAEKAALEYKQDSLLK